MASTTEVRTAPKKVARLTKGSKILKEIVSAVQDKKGENIITLDLRQIPEAVADFFIVCEANATVQVKAIADHVEEKVKKECGELPYKHEGFSASQWILIDYVNVVVHVFLSETRKFYRLEEMWSDAAASEDPKPSSQSVKTANKRKKKTL